MVHGNPGFGRQIPFSLEDFDCTSPIPPWLPADRWEDLLAFSILPGNLEGICARVAQASEVWKAWYDSSEPEVSKFFYLLQYRMDLFLFYCLSFQIHVALQRHRRCVLGKDV